MSFYKCFSSLTKEFLVLFSDGIRFLIDKERSGGKKSCFQEVVKCFLSTIPFLGGRFGPCSCNSNPSPVIPEIFCKTWLSYAVDNNNVVIRCVNDKTWLVNFARHNGRFVFMEGW
ncbi:hypothetical protein Hanom_Chr14g01253801 [Helianthus anomalus]